MKVDMERMERRVRMRGFGGIFVLFYCSSSVEFGVFHRKGDKSFRYEKGRIFGITSLYLDVFRIYKVQQSFEEE